MDIPKKAQTIWLPKKVCPQTVKKRQRTAGIRRPLHLFQQVCSCTVQQPPIKPVETASQSSKSCKCTTNTTNITLKCSTVWIWKVIASFWHRWVLLSIHVNCQSFSGGAVLHAVVEDVQRLGQAGGWDKTPDYWKRRSEKDFGAAKSFICFKKVRWRFSAKNFLRI